MAVPFARSSRLISTWDVQPFIIPFSFSAALRRPTITHLLGDMVVLVVSIKRLDHVHVERFDAQVEPLSSTCLDEVFTVVIP